MAVLSGEEARERALSNSRLLGRPVRAGIPVSEVLAAADSDGTFHTTDRRYGVPVTCDVTPLRDLGDPDAVVGFSFAYHWRPEWIRERVRRGGRASPPEAGA
jgi:hypothetical protein